MLSRVVKLAAWLALLYLGAVAVVFFTQRSFVYPAPSQIAPLPAGYRAVSYRTDDALTLKAAYRPAAPGRPTAVFFHGNGDSWNGAARATSQLAKAGYGVLLPEYRGYGGNPGGPSEGGLYSDGRAALRWLRAQGIAPSQIAIIGNSIGSGVAVQLASEAAPAALILVSPFENLAELAAGQFRWLPARWLLRDRYDNLAKIGRIDAPILILHGRADRLIPFAQAEGLARASRRATLLSFADAGHELAYLNPAGAATVAWLDSMFATRGGGDQARPGSAPSTFSPSAPP
jgi:fermentation-respiration switch protein FrsA (DUF1100 family)